LKKISKEINKSKKVQVHGLKIATKKDIEDVKLSRYDKTYSAQVTFTKSIDKKKITLIKKLKGVVVQQRTPQRVSHRRADLVRKRKIKSISTKQLDDKKLNIVIKGEAGLYIKELISGDEGRTKPSISELIDNKVKKIDLDVLKIHC
jgi:tRNA pseudouridine synthase 10